MSTDEIQRLQQDLNTIRGAIRTDNPYDRADVLPLLAIAFGALVTIPMLHFRMFHNPRLCLLVGLAPGIATLVRRYFQTRNDQASRPGIWKEYKWGLLFACLAAPAAAGWLWWSQRFGVDRQATGAAIIFCLGIAAIMIGYIDCSRRTYLAGGIMATIFAFVLPTLEPQHFPTVSCIFLAAKCSVVAALIWWLTRETTPANGESTVTK